VHPTVEELLKAGINPRLLGAEAPLVAELSKGFKPVSGESPLERLVHHVRSYTEACADRVATLHTEFEEFSARHARAETEAERREFITDFARTLGASEHGVREDRKAFSRWFGLDAMVDRYRRRVGEEERRISFALGRLGLIAANALTAASVPETLPGLWRRMEIEPLSSRLMDHTGDGRVRAAAFRCLANALRALPVGLQEGILGEGTLRRLYRTALEPSGDVWTEEEALSLLRDASPEVFGRALQVRLTQPASGDDFFLRRRAVMLLCGVLRERPALGALLPIVLHDPSPGVRQALALRLHQAPPELISVHMAALALDDPAPEVRAATLTTVLEHLAGGGHVLARETFVRVMREESSALVLRTALLFAGRGLAWLLREAPAEALAWQQALQPEIERLHESAGLLAVRRWAAQARERMWCAADPVARVLIERLRSGVEGMSEGRSRRIRAAREAMHVDPAVLGRVLAVLAQEDFGYDVAGGARVRRGDRFRFRLWRALHEMRHPSPDKRQAFPHTIGRVFNGQLAAPSAIMAELAQTKVPGEPFLIAEEAGWRPYLPLPDHALSAIDSGETVRLYTAEGVTEMDPPSGFLRRIVARTRLTLSFPALAELRNWNEGRGQAPGTYLRTLGMLGFRFRLVRYPGTAVDPSVARFFPAMLPPLPFADGSSWRRFESYFVSVYENTLEQLALFLGLSIAWFIGRHVWINARMRRARDAIPLVLGGWGTRGKSGTERLKAALISGLGYKLISKTTGCEAMFLVGEPFGQVREMFLFRPYDKATIWEQMDVVRLAARVKADVFLWECMGLTASYVQVLQRHWMRDDISTITNTYPDHEDLQGPAGRNIPEVMTNFIPRGGTLLTTEEQMRPILSDAARDLGTRMVPVGWLEAGLIPADALARFPYEEHPFNIALVMALAEELGVERDFALKEMADRVVPDLGVLKSFPVATVRTRRLEFINGMSANERFGALTNWTRMGFDNQNPEHDPPVWLTTVVNNRADRVSRSRVFATMLANDLAADRHVLIGSNLQGMQGYIEEAWQVRVGGLTLWPDTVEGHEADPLNSLAAAARWMRIPHGGEWVNAFLRAMLEGQPEPVDTENLLALSDDPEALARSLAEAGVAEAEDIVTYHRGILQAAAEYEMLAQTIRAGGDRAALNTAFRETLSIWFRRKIVVVEDFHASGDQVVDRVRAETPPGFLNRVMGVQNIKGTGLDFVYRWQAWDAAHAALHKAKSGNPVQAADGLRTLSAFQEFGVLSEEATHEVLAALRSAPPVSGSVFLDQIELAQSNLNRQLAEMRATMIVTRGVSTWSKLVDWVEAMLDAGDAVRRRRTAERIYRDLIAERVSLDRAAVELKKLNARQKGGWLADAIQRSGGRLRDLIRAVRAPHRGNSQQEPSI